MDKFYNDKRKIFSSNNFNNNNNNNKANDELFVYVPKLKSYKGMFRVFFYILCKFY